MLIVSILSVLIFSTILCIVEIPKMLKENLHRELWTFSILLGLGTVLAILKSLNVDIPNPSDFIAWVYSPLTNIVKNLLE
ncbi:hypothetical protein [Clostridium ljungdahlii]|uniref:Hypothetical membrane protein n=1 Tax=Clostridium ljungdahlii (strain ATCC 55383 / DSM 13528 / PETC) TaxID=748727 RepID=D8GUQ3_CLOLD|nr:hypothetical protein [Clostridium ljungdahlii]ADK16930.1 hypothetical membrane protein [Clostridium ljungdahlii DSM 13528]OAA85307.1 hypothetical protein WX45_00542 [Clostridium ljungdahlii DSM 13528]